MGPTASAANFGTHHAMRFVLNLHDVTFGECPIERRPASATGELAGGFKQRESAHHAAIDAVFFVVEQGSAEGSFGSRSLRDSDLLFGQVLTTFFNL